MDDDEPERPATMLFWVVCGQCGTFDLDSADFMFPIREGSHQESDELHVAHVCPRCAGWCQLHMKRMLKPLQ